MYSNLDEISAPEPVQNPDDSHDTSGSVSNTMTREDDDGYENLDELADPAPDQNPEERGTYRHSNLEDEREGQHNSSGDRSHAHYFKMVHRIHGLVLSGSLLDTWNPCQTRITGAHKISRSSSTQY
ncbi:hypothetical protein VTO58DRAFT_106365 [Aureobasidium pullulans]